MMKKIILLPSLVVIFILKFINTSMAECRFPPCKKLESVGTCGEGCTYTYDQSTQTVYISTAGNDSKMAYGAFHPQYYENNYLPYLNYIIDGPISIGGNAFTANVETISGANGTLILTGINHHGFGDNATLSGNIVIPANARFGSIAFHGVTLADGAKIYCAVENCAQKMIDSCNAYGDADGYRTRYLNVVQTIISDEDKFEQAPEGCDFWSSEGCSKCTNSNYSLEYGYCYRKRYTIQEADAATSDDNENMIEWIFE
ncbi:MAG: hypothetical protein IJ564_03215 [Alphaproteobacteria bacterium]|nr:hypothetical protein [Alphaproteobacteria bacterium]